MLIGGMQLIYLSTEERAVGSNFASNRMAAMLAPDPTDRVLALRVARSRQLGLLAGALTMEFTDAVGILCYTGKHINKINVLYGWPGIYEAIRMGSKTCVDAIRRPTPSAN